MFDMCEPRETGVKMRERAQWRKVSATGRNRRKRQTRSEKTKAEIAEITSNRSKDSGEMEMKFCEGSR